RAGRVAAVLRGGGGGPHRAVVLLAAVAGAPRIARAALTDAVLRWADACDRPLPWRGVRDPYRVLVSEVMLQQTQASRVVPAYCAFLVRFPSLDSLAGADAGDVIRAW